MVVNETTGNLEPGNKSSDIGLFVEIMIKLIRRGQATHIQHSYAIPIGSAISRTFRLYFSTPVRLGMIPRILL